MARAITLIAVPHRSNHCSSGLTAEVISMFWFSGRALSYQNWQFIHHGPLQPVVMPHDA
jgi:hypothetical protein